LKVNTSYPPPRGQQLSATGRKSWPARHKILTAILSVVALFVVLAIAGALAGPPKTNRPGSAAQTTPRASSSRSATVTTTHRKATSAKSASLAKAENACSRRPMGGQIYVRMIVPGIATTAQELGGEWAWDHVTNQCDDSVAWMMATAPMTAGNCTQVGFVSQNPGYNPNATPARPLKSVVAQAGPACD
jgi:hypothetical protein